MRCKLNSTVWTGEVEVEEVGSREVKNKLNFTMPSESELHYFGEFMRGLL